MAAILEQSPVCDGFDVRCRLTDGSMRVFHFAAAPADVQAAVDQVEAALMAVQSEPAPPPTPPEGP
jgi:hypothetical protein